MQRYSSRWVIESQDPGRMRLIRWGFTLTKLSVVVAWGVWWVWTTWIHNPGWILEGLQGYGWLGQMVITFIAFLVFSHVFNSGAKRVESDTLVRYGRSLQGLLAVREPVTFRVVYWGGLNWSIGGRAWLDGRSKDLEHQVYGTLVRMKLSTHVGVLVFQVVGVSVYFLALPWILSWIYVAFNLPLTQGGQSANLLGVVHEIHMMLVVFVVMMCVTFSFLPVAMIDYPAVFRLDEPLPRRLGKAGGIIGMLYLGALLGVAPPLFFLSVLCALLLAGLAPLLVWLLATYVLHGLVWGFVRRGDLPPIEGSD